MSSRTAQTHTLWKDQFRRRLLSPVTGFLVALLVWQTAYEMFGPNIIPPLVTTAEAAYDYMQPNNDGSVTAAQTSCTTASSSSCLDDGVPTSSAPDTGSNYLTFSNGDVDNYEMTELTSVDTTSLIHVPVYHRETGNNMTLSVSLWDSSETVQYGSTFNLPYTGTTQWGTASFSVALSQAQLDGLKVRLSCARSGGKPNNCLAYAMFGAVTYSEAVDVTVGSLGAQQDLAIPTTTAYVGGAFSIIENSSSRDITSITISEQGSVNAQTNLDNIKLFYEFDTTGGDGYNCSDQAYNGGGAETQFGSTDTDGFSAANGISTFTSSGVTITTTQSMCVYVVLDVLSGATAGQDLEIQITDPSTQVVGSGSPIISPSSPVLLPDTTTLRKAVIAQKNFHWRNDVGDEAGATSATGGTENDPYDTMPKGPTKRVRFSVANEGNATSTALQLRLEYATKTLSCTGLTYVDVGATGGAFDMSPTGNLTDGDDTDNTISVAIGGVSDPVSYTFVTPNGGIKDTSSQTGNITLQEQEFVELEYAIVADTNITDGTAYCFRVSNAGTALSTYTNYAEATIAADVLVDATSTQTSIITIPSATAQYAGGAFRITDTTAGAATLTSVTITASGTVDAQNDISNIQLRYDLDVTSPYTCDDVSYANTDTPFGSPVSNFNGSNQATFTGSVSNSPTQTVCLYVEYEVGAGANNGEQLDIRILDPSTEVVIGGSSVAPAAPVDIVGVTTFAAPYLEQADYHWRNNDGDKSGATSATGDTENTLFEEFPKNTTYRLRFSIGNTGLAAAPETRYRLEWAQKTTNCALATNWIPVDTASDEWEMSPTGNLTEGDDTTDITLPFGGVGDPAGTFLSNNNGINDTTDLTASSTLLANYYLDLEYAIRATDDAVQGATYCFRATSTTQAIDVYTNYAEAQIKLDTDFKVQRDTETITGTSTTIYAGSDYEAPSSTQNAFIRITNTGHTGAGPNTGNSSSNADDVTVYIVNPENLGTSITFARAAFPAGNTRVSWEIVEYTGAPGGENEVIVRRAESVSYAGAATVSGTVTNTVASDNDVVVFITGQYNSDAGKNGYFYGLSTAAWNGTTNQADFTRGAAGSDSTVSYAIVEFTGTNWKVQRVSHTYDSAGSASTSPITAVNPLHAFLHVQKRTSENDHADFGHEVWLSGMTQVSFLLDPQAANPANHTSVAWVIENTQTQGVVLTINRINSSFPSGGVGGPESNLVPIGTTLDDLSIVSLFVNNRSDETQRSWPEPILGVTLASATHVELWQSDTSANINYQIEVVQWPTAARKLEQDHFRIYKDNGLLTPTTPWPTETGTLGEDAPMTADDFPMVNGSSTRIRMTLLVKASAMPAGLDTFKLQYGLLEGASCNAITNWLALGEPGSTTALWRGVDHTPADGDPLSTEPPVPADLKISFATVAGTYEESNNTALNPYTAHPEDQVEYDWVVQHNGAQDKSSYCFRMVEADGTDLEKYNTYPILRTVGYEPVLKTWRWYDDETNSTPSTPLAAYNVAPVDIVNENVIKLRMTIQESSGANGNNNKFALQYSEYANFSQGVHTLTSTTSCEADSLWCYADGAGVDNAIISSAVIADADSCVASVGDGCGTHNEGTSTVTATFDQPAYSTSEFEFTLQHAGARANAVYYFRLYDLTADEVVGLGATSSYPSLVTEGPQLVSTLSGVTSGTTVGDVTSDVATTPSTINFGSVPVNSSYEAIQQLAVDTNATEGYQLLVYATQPLTNSYGELIPNVTGSNAVPKGWSAGCAATSTGCFGYHTTDAVLEGGDGRFSPIDSYAAFETAPREVAYSSMPTNDTHYMIYRILVTQLQPAGDYETGIVYISVPVY